jgi:ribosome-binding factor A
VVSKNRLDRINERILEELSALLLMEASDPRLSGVSVTDVDVDRELAYANIYVSALEGSERSKEILEGLEHASGFLRHELAIRVDLRTFPRLRFHWDPTFERAARIEEIFASLEDNPSEGEDPAANE